VRTQGRAVRIEIDQAGTEWRVKNGYAHRWTETARRVIAEPFELRLPSGELLPVEPDQRVFLVDKLDQVVATDPSKRTRAAELTDGEVVYAVGDIAEGAIDPSGSFEGYREAPKRKKVLRAPKGGRLLLASEPLGARYWARVRFHIRWFLFVLAALAMMHAGVFLGFNLRVFRGHTVDARVSSLRHYTTGSGKSRTTYDMVGAHSLDFSETFNEDARASSFRQLEIGAIIPVTVVDGWPKVTQLGATPTASIGRFFLMLVFMLICAFGYPASRQKSRPWYDQPKVIDEGGGKLYPPPRK
jgi:hypothetical protein